MRRPRQGTTSGGALACRHDSPMRAVPVSSSIRGRPHLFFTAGTPLPQRPDFHRHPSDNHRSGPAWREPKVLRMPIHSSVLELIGQTPIVKAQRLDTGVCELYLKLESANPGGSIKDRIGGEARRPETWRDPGRGHRWQHRPGPGPGGPAEGLQAHSGRSRQDESGKDLQPEGDGR